MRFRAWRWQPPADVCVWTTTCAMSLAEQIVPDKSTAPANQVAELRGLASQRAVLNVARSRVSSTDFDQLPEQHAANLCSLRFCRHVTEV